jgi:hypothetical protein
MLLKAWLPEWMVYDGEVPGAYAGLELVDVGIGVYVSRWASVAGPPRVEYIHENISRIVGRVDWVRAFPEAHSASAVIRCDEIPFLADLQFKEVGVVNAESIQAGQIIMVEGGVSVLEDFRYDVPGLPEIGRNWRVESLQPFNDIGDLLELNSLD